MVEFTNAPKEMKPPRKIALKIVERYQQARKIRDLHGRLPNRPRGEIAKGLIVSLTSFPARIGTAWITIETILKQDARPEHVTLTLSRSEFGNSNSLPDEIKIQQRHGLEIIWTDENLRSYGKLLPALAKYPDATIVTIDDDMVYKDGLIEELIIASSKNPETIVGHRGYTIQIGHENKIMPYSKWRPITDAVKCDLCLLTGAGGILYPPHSLPRTTTNDRQLFQRLCPDADDIWFWAMALLNNTPRLCLGNHKLEVIKRIFTTPRLSKNNIRGGGNDRQLKNILQYLRNHHGIEISTF